MCCADAHAYMSLLHTLSTAVRGAQGTLDKIGVSAQFKLEGYEAMEGRLNSLKVEKVSSYELAGMVVTLFKKQQQFA
jgi:hypothetical protein